MSDNLTGFDPEKVKFELRSLLEYGFDIGLKLDVGGINAYYNILKNIWCSPKAVEFSKKVFPILDNCTIDIYNLYWNLVDSGQSAYNTNAGVHGTPLLNEFTDSGAEKHITETNKVLLEASASGEIGMEKEKVRIATESFLNYIGTEVIPSLEQTPMNISFFDPQGQQQANFKQSILKIVESLKEAIKTIATEVNNYMGTELDSVDLGVKNASEALSSTQPVAN